MKPINRDIQLLNAIDALLSESPAGLREIQLINQLDEHYPSVFPKPDLSDQWLLFQHHFVLRHHIYVLQEQLLKQQHATLDVSPILIQKKPFQASRDTLPSEHDSVREFYLNFENLFKESEASVQTMLDDFWQALARYQYKPDALKTLGLNGSETKAEQKQQYRQLVQKYHPDKGGDPEVFRDIQQAWEQIQPLPKTKKPLD